MSHICTNNWWYRSVCQTISFSAHFWFYCELLYTMYITTNHFHLSNARLYLLMNTNHFKFNSSFDVFSLFVSIFPQNGVSSENFISFTRWFTVGSTSLSTRRGGRCLVSQREIIQSKYLNHFTIQSLKVETICDEFLHCFPSKKEEIKWMNALMIDEWTLLTS